MSDENNDWRNALYDHLDEALRHDRVQVAVRDTVQWFLNPEDPDIDPVDASAEEVTAEAWESAAVIIEQWSKGEQYHADVLDEVEEHE